MTRLARLHRRARPHPKTHTAAAAAKGNLPRLQHRRLFSASSVNVRSKVHFEIMERVTFFSASGRYCSRGIGAIFWMGWADGRKGGRRRRGRGRRKALGGVEKCHKRCWSESWRGRRPFPGWREKGKTRCLNQSSSKKKLLAPWLVFWSSTLESNDD